MRYFTIVFLLGVASSCAGPSGSPKGADSDAGVMQDSGEAAPDAVEGDSGRDGSGIASRCADARGPAGFDEARAARGYEALTAQLIGRGIIPRLGLENLWVVWGGPRLTGDAYWVKFRERYGFHEAPFDNNGLPLGFRLDGSNVAITCLGCHAGVVAGRTIVGAANTTVDYESLYEDLVRLNELAPTYGFPTFAVPFDLTGFTGAAGVSDAMGLAMELSERYAGTSNAVNHDYGYQRSPAWWTVSYKPRLYTDGAGQTGGHRTMMAMLLAFGLSPGELEALDETIEDIGHYMRSVETPCWELGALNENLVERGAEIYARDCAECHDSSTVADVGTDAVRTDNWGSAETTWVNASWFGTPPFQDTDGYLAQPLNGIWARAPYLHNGSVPTLAALLAPDERPPRWRRLGSALEDYDVDAVGWRFEVVDASTPSRAVFDSEREGLGNGGHTFGSELSDPDRTALLEYLKSL